MLSNFIIAAKAVIPTFLLILLGIGGRQFHIMTDTELNHANKAVFEIMFPIMMFYNIYSADFSGVIIPRYIAFCVVMLFIVYGLGVVVTLLTEKENYNRGALIQAIYRSNFVLMGIPIMKNLMGEEALGLTTIMVAFIIPIYNTLAVVTLEVFRGGTLHVSTILKRIITNPMILGAGAGLIAAGFRLQLPAILATPMSQVSSAASTIALMIMGATFRLGSIRENSKNLVIGVGQTDCQSGSCFDGRISAWSSGSSAGIADCYVRCALCGIWLYDGTADGQ